MDALIENFLTETKAVTPVRNPSFNPKAYRIEDEGVQKPKGPQKTSKQKKKTKAENRHPNAGGGRAE